MEKKNPRNNVNCVTERIENCNNNNNNTDGLKVKRTRKSAPRGSPMQRSSAFRGVTKHRGTGRFEAHLWDKNCWNESQNKRGKQVYLGAYDMENAAARAYDLAALKYWGEKTKLNFPVSEYEEELRDMKAYTKEEYIGIIRRRSSGFSRGASKYRGVARHHHNGRWEARIGRVLGNKYLYLGTFATEEEAATAYDKAAILHRGLNAITNFDRSRYFEPDTVITNVPSNTDQPSDPAVHTETWYAMPIHSLPQSPNNDVTVAFTDGLETRLADDNINGSVITTSFEYPYIDYQWQFPEFQGCFLNDVHNSFFEYEEMGWFPSPLYQY